MGGFASSYAERVRVSRLAACALAITLVACAGSGDEGEPPPATRPTIAPRVTTAATADSVTGDVPSDAAQVEVETTTTMPVPLEYSIEFEDLGAGVDGGWITVPLDYADPQGETIDLWVTRHRAASDERVGVLLANNGGPAPSGMALVCPAPSCATDVSKP